MGWKLLLAVHCHLVVWAQCVVDLSGKIYQTHAALEKENLMFCYECNTMVNGKSCSNFTDKDEYLKFSTKCTGEKKTCMVKRYSYTTSNESATSGQQLWSLERKCSGKCEDGCIVIGERIKIYACQACCETPLCNVSNGGRAAGPPTQVALAYCLTFILFLLLRMAYAVNDAPRGSAEECCGPRRTRCLTRDRDSRGGAENGTETSAERLHTAPNSYFRNTSSNLQYLQNQKSNFSPQNHGSN